MTNIVARLLSGTQPVLAGARPQDAAAIAALHAASFRRGWDEDEVYRLLLDHAVVAHCAVMRRTVVGFIMSRLAADEAEILSVAIAPARRGRGLSRPLLNFHLRGLAGRGARAVFLEVDEQNQAARRLYSGSGFGEVGRRQGYYESGATALVLRRDLD
jgi:[ribosomal protein S18]-alanine N-acetyltransferase